MDVWLTALEDRFVEKCMLIGWWAWQSVCNYFMSDWVEINADFSDYVCLTPADVLCTQFCGLTQGVQSRRNVRELRRFMKSHVQIYIPKRHRMYEKYLLNLMKSSIPDISARTLTIFSVEILEKLCQTIWRLHKTRLQIFQFLKIDKYFCPFLNYLIFSRERFSSEMLPLLLGEKPLIFVNSKWRLNSQQGRLFILKFR